MLRRPCWCTVGTLTWPPHAQTGLTAALHLKINSLEFKVIFHQLLKDICRKKELNLHFTELNFVGNSAWHTALLSRNSNDCKSWQIVCICPERRIRILMAVLYNIQCASVHHGNSEINCRWRQCKPPIADADDVSDLIEPPWNPKLCHL